MLNEVVPIVILFYNWYCFANFYKRCLEIDQIFFSLFSRLEL